VAAPEIEVKYLEAGREYLAGLRKLGFDPQALLWAYDQAMNTFVLVLVTELFDFMGPYEISKLLFKAYNLAATPREIDPFVIRLHSSNHSIVEDGNLLLFAMGGTAETFDPATKERKAKTTFSGGSTGGLQVERKWAFTIKHARKMDRITASRRWNRIQRNVDRLAA
jgi:hypothetical protein